MPSDASLPHRVVVVVGDDVAWLELSVAIEVFAEHHPDDLLAGAYELVLCTEAPPSVTLSTGITVEVPRGLGALRRADTVIVPGWPSRIPPSDAVVSALRAAHDRGARMVSFCSGAFVLAAAGILDGRPATTHWNAADRFRARFPAVRLDPTVLYVDDGDVLTSAGAAASVDLALHLVRLDHGAAAAAALARELVVPPHRHGGQAQYIEAPVPQFADLPDPIAATIEWALANLAEPLTLDQLADHAHLSRRHFARRFVEATGTTAHQWLLTQRVALAQRLLETTDLSVEQVAVDAGFGSAPTLRTHFQRHVGTTPNSYRRTFRGDPLERTA